MVEPWSRELMQFSLNGELGGLWTCFSGTENVRSRSRFPRMQSQSPPTLKGKSKTLASKVSFSPTVKPRERRKRSFDVLTCRSRAQEPARALPKNQESHSKLENQLRFLKDNVLATNLSRSFAYQSLLERFCHIIR